ncbi:MAG: glycosidase, partial [Verrucomicrobia bacterium]
MTKPKRTALHAKRIGPTLIPDRSRVLIRPFRPTTDDIARRIVARIMSLPEDQVPKLLGQVLGEFADRHEHVERIFRARFELVKIYLEPGAQLSPERQMLIGAFFTHEYSPESAALFNPSIVPHPDQSGLPKGALRFILSLRAIGEGHISSITFRTGSVSAQHRITLTPPVPFAAEPERVPNAAYTKGLFANKLQEAGVQNDFCRRVLDKLHEDFTLKELHAILLASGLTSDTSDATATRAARGILLLAESNYEVNFAPDSRVSQRVLFPSTPSQSNGIEDARFVRFRNDDGSFTYYATYTAYDGKITLPQLLQTP